MGVIDALGKKDRTKIRRASVGQHIVIGQRVIGNSSRAKTGNGKNVPFRTEVPFEEANFWFSVRGKLFTEGPINDATEFIYNWLRAENVTGPDTLKKYLTVRSWISDLRRRRLLGPDINKLTIPNNRYVEYYLQNGRCADTTVLSEKMLTDDIAVVNRITVNARSVS